MKRLIIILALGALAISAQTTPLGPLAIPFITWPAMCGTPAAPVLLCSGPIPFGWQDYYLIVIPDAAPRVTSFVFTVEGKALADGSTVTITDALVNQAQGGMSRRVVNFGAAMDPATVRFVSIQDQGPLAAPRRFGSPR